MTITSKLILAAVAAALTGTFALQAQTITETTEPVTAGEVTIDPDVNYRPLDRIVASSRKRPCNRERAKSACVWTSRW